MKIITEDNEFIVITCGFGTNSLAMIIECVLRGIHIDLIIFSDTGGEKPHTYEYIDIFNAWLINNGFPEVITVRKGGNGETLEEECLRKHCLPSLAYGFKTCSQKYKIQPIDKFLNNYEPAKKIWKAGGKVTKYVGFDADEAHRIKDYDDKKYNVRYPLVDWDMGREECIETIEREGLPLPGKSACFFCPSSRKHEITNLKIEYPDLLDRAIRMEENAELSSIKGLGRSFSWKNLVATDDMFEGEYESKIEIDCGCYDG